MKSTSHTCQRFGLLVGLVAAALLTSTIGCSKEQPDQPAKHIVLTIEGMTCQNCADLLTDKLGEMPGVTQCSVSFENKQAVLDLVPGKGTSEADLVAKVASLKKYKVVEPPLPAVTPDSGAKP